MNDNKNITVITNSLTNRQKTRQEYTDEILALLLEHEEVSYVEAKEIFDDVLRLLSIMPIKDCYGYAETK